MDRVSMSVTAKGKRWEILHSLWIGWTFTLGFFNWVAFFYIGIRARQRKWAFWGIFYMVPFVLAMLNPNLDNWLGDLTALLIVVSGVMGIVHALRLRGDYLRRLETLESGDATAGSASRFPPSDSRWELRHSLWIGWTFTLGLFNWIAFIYIGLRAKEWKWILWGVLYLVPIAVVILLLAADASAALGAPAVLLMFGMGVASIFHAFHIRKEYLGFLETLQRRRSSREEILKRQLSGAETTRTAEDLSQNTESVDKVHPTRPHREPNEPPIHPKESAYTPSSATFEDPTARPVAPPGTASNQPPKVSPSPEPEPPLVVIDNPPNQVASERVGAPSIPTNYPLPLAYSYRLADAEFETFRVLKELYRNAEGLTAFLASLALVLAPTPTGKRKDTLLRAWRGKGATFGSWYAILEKTTPTIEENKGHLYRSMQQLLGTKANPSSFAETMTWLIDRRNDLHHGDLPVGPRADLLIQEVRSKFEHCVSESAALWQHPLRLVLDYDAVRNNNYVVATCLDFSGDHPVGRKVQERYQGIPKKQDLYILQDGKQWISLYPFISVHYIVLR
jgi:hypothetical protein